MCDQNDIELKAAMEEYRALKAEVLANQNAARQITTLTLAFAGALVGAYKTVHDAIQLAPAVFIGLMLMHLRYSFLALRMGEYLRCNPVKRIQQRFKTGDEQTSNVMGWECASADGLPTVGILIKGGAFAIPLAGVFVVGFAERFPWWLWLVYGGLAAYCFYFAVVAVLRRDSAGPASMDWRCRSIFWYRPLPSKDHAPPQE